MLTRRLGARRESRHTVGAGTGRSGWRHRRALVLTVLALLMVSLLLLVVDVVRARSFGAERYRRAQELESREPEPDRIYMARFRRSEAQVRQNDQEIT